MADDRSDQRSTRAACAILLRQVQDVTGWTQAEVGASLGWAQSKVSKRMNLRGATSSTDLAQVVQLREALRG